MTDCQIVVHKEVLTDTSYVPGFTLKLTVSETSVGVTPCIFVHEYIPKNPYTGKISYEFSNVAYYDELTEVKDYVTDKRNSCLLRRSCIEKRFQSYEQLQQFLSTVTKDIQRLIQQLSSVYSLEDCESITITKDTTSVAPCSSASDDDAVATGNAEAIVLSFDGKTTNN